MAMVFQTNILKKEEGFTLAELLIVIVIMGLLSTLAFYNAGDMVYRYRLDTKAKELASDLRLAQQTAIYRAGDVSFVIDGNSYVIEDAGGVLKTVELPTNLELNPSSIEITFSAKGRINNNVNITLQYQNFTLERQVSVTSAGIIKVEP